MTEASRRGRPRLTVGLAGSIVPPFSGVTRNARRCEAAGAEAIWFPDHLMGFWPQSLWTPRVTLLAAAQPSPHVFLDPFVAMSAAGSATNRILLGTAVTQPLSRHPAHLAQTFLSLSHLTGGRVILGLGAGEAENLAPYGVNVDRAAGRVAEALEIIRLLWFATEPVTFEGEFWTLRDAVLGLSPSPEAPAPPVWLAAHGPRMLALAGRLADGWLPLNMPVEEYRGALDRIRAAALAAGRAPDAIRPAVWGFTVVHDQAGEVDRLLDHPLIKCVCLMFGAEAFGRHGVEHPLGGAASGFRDYIPSRLTEREALAAIGRVPPQVVRERLFAGTPAQLAAQLRALEAAGASHAVLWNITFLADPTLTGRSFRLLEDVAAAFDGSAACPPPM